MGTGAMSQRAKRALMQAMMAQNDLAAALTAEIAYLDAATQITEGWRDLAYATLSGGALGVATGGLSYASRVAEEIGWLSGENASRSRAVWNIAGLASGIANAVNNARLIATGADQTRVLISSLPGNSLWGVDVLSSAGRIYSPISGFAQQLSPFAGQAIYGWLFE